jgi:uncharacterized membrane protein
MEENWCLKLKILLLPYYAKNSAMYVTYAQNEQLIYVKKKTNWPKFAEIGKNSYNSKNR